jgi:ABC-type glycerol-3-phosphate transport system substrate-binding protein
MAANFTRRGVLKTSALAGAATLAAPYVKRAYGAGTLSVGFWDHWVPGANDACTKLCQEWAAQENVDIQVDYITSQGFKNLLTIQAEAQARAGHDILSFPTWEPANHSEQLEPVDDLMAELTEANGAVNAVVEYLGRPEGRWVVVPQTPGSQIKGPCGRLDRLKEYAGVDPQAMYPAGAPANEELAAQWTWDAFLAAAEKCKAAGHPFGLGLGVTSDCVDWVGSLFNAFGADLVDQDGNIVVDSDQTRAVLEYAKRLVPNLPDDVFAWDDASNNRFLVSGNGSLIFNPPSAWAVAKRDAPEVAEKLWTFPSPAGPEGRFGPYLPYFWGIWSFSPNKEAAKSLLRYLSRRESAQAFVAASQGYDLPAYANFQDFDTWAKEGPPPGTLTHYPARPGEQELSIAAAPAPPRIAVQVYNQAINTKMISRITQGGESIEDAISWAANELEGFMRT